MHPWLEYRGSVAVFFYCFPSDVTWFQFVSLLVINFDHLIKGVSAGLLHCQVILFSYFVINMLFVVRYFEVLLINFQFSHLFMSVWIYGVLFYYMDWNLICLLLILMLRLFQIWPMGILSSWFLFSVDLFSSFFEHFHIFWARR